MTSSLSSWDIVRNIECLQLGSRSVTIAPTASDSATHNLSSHQDIVQGSCLCRNITVKVNQHGLFDKLNGGTCHCYNCRQFSGGASANILFLPTENLHVLVPKAFLKTYNDSKTASGRLVPRSLCSNCGCPIGCLALRSHSLTSVVMPGLCPRIPEPEFEVFTKQRQQRLKPLAAEDGQSNVAEKLLDFVAHLLQ